MENMTFERRCYSIGKVYKERKRENRQLKKSGVRTSWEVGAEFGVDHSTVERAEYFMDGIDAIAEIYPNLAESILNGETKISQRAIVAIGKAEFADQANMIRHLHDGRRVEGVPTKDNAKQSLQNMNAIAFAVAGITGQTGRAEYTMENMVRDISVNSASFVNSLKRILEGNTDLCRANKREVISALNKHIVKEIEKFEEEILLL